ncbi:MAG TPA: S-layer homology domain-containing protein [Syntrophomonas sp.]|nr:S-layer homology domain-containing protein [Syntrophomonas sp.]
MKRFINKNFKIFAIVLVMIMVFTIPVSAQANTGRTELQTALQSTAAWLMRTVPQPDSATVGGEWAVMGLARSDCDVPPEWYDHYYSNLLEVVQESNGILSTRKYTEYSRVILALTALGNDPADVGGYNLLTMLGDYDKVLVQGINGPIFALLALDSGSYDMPVCATAQQQASREMYIDYILSRQQEDGGWSLAGSASEPDVTGMALQALAGYQSIPSVKEAIDRSVNYLSGLQNETGGFVSGGTANVESTVQVMMALCELKIDPQGSLFTKNGHTLPDNLLDYYVTGGGFKHTAAATASDIMGTEQGFYALAAYQRYLDGQNSFYNMSDVKALPGMQPGSPGLAGKNADVSAVKATQNGRTFDDIQGLEAQPAIEALAARGIINGVGYNTFEPDRSMTRAEFAAIVVRALGLTPSAERVVFTDVTEGSWYAGYVGTAYKYGIVSGTSSSTFTPEATITREEAAVMTARAAGLCGLDTAMNEQAIHDMLAQFADYTTSSNWARASLAFCYRQGILAQDEVNIEPGVAITRTEIAVMLYRMLLKAELIQ